MNGSGNVSYAVAFIFGVLTFLSPCLLPLIPSFVAYITGVSFGDLKDAGKKNEVRKKTAAHSLIFICGFSVVFIALGLTATLIGKTLFEYQKAIRIAGGALIFLFGLNLAGVLRADFLGKEFKLHLPVRSATYLGSFLVGVTFAAAWTPCAGPILGSILAIAGTETDLRRGALLLAAYSAGIGLPFFITGMLVNSFLQAFNRFKGVIAKINIVAGAMLVVVGILVMTDYLNVIGEKLTRIFIR